MREAWGQRTGWLSLSPEHTERFCGPELDFSTDPTSPVPQTSPAHPSPVPPTLPGTAPGPFKRCSLRRSKHTSKSRQRALFLAVPYTFPSSFRTSHWFSFGSREASEPARLGERVHGTVSAALPPAPNDICFASTPTAPRAALASAQGRVFNKATAPKHPPQLFFFDNLPLSHQQKN